VIGKSEAADNKIVAKTKPVARKTDEAPRQGKARNVGNIIQKRLNRYLRKELTGYDRFKTEYPLMTIDHGLELGRVDICFKHESKKGLYIIEIDTASGTQGTQNVCKSYFHSRNSVDNIRAFIQIFGPVFYLETTGGSFQYRVVAEFTGRKMFGEKYFATPIPYDGRIDNFNKSSDDEIDAIVTLLAKKIRDFLRQLEKKE